MKAILLLSGGIDSTVVLADLIAKGYEVHALIFDYGQTLLKEVDVAYGNAILYGAAEITVVRAPLTWLPSPCAILQGNQDKIAKGRTIRQIQESGTPTSYVPFRNGILLSYAVAYGEATVIEDIYTGGNGLYSGNYWDDTRAFACAITVAAQIGTSPQYRPQVRFPFAEIPKAAIVTRGISLGVDFTQTWSCYHNGTQHCGKCDSCQQRRVALEQHGFTLNGGRRVSG